MTLYARSDISSVTISAAHGGCGKVHTRPAPGGKPAKIWALECHPCENHLRNDPLWSSTISKIPETYDEVLFREETEKARARDQHDILVQSLAVLAGKESGGAAPVFCPEGHASPAGAKFCVECGASLTAAAARCPDGHESPAGARFCVECGKSTAPALEAAPEPSQDDGEDAPGGGEDDLVALNVQKLRKMCRDAGLDDTGSKAEMAARLRAREQ